MDFLSLLLGTVLLRPYVFAFLLCFLALAWVQIGWTRTIVWTATGYLIAFAAEYGSIHWGVPFGEYYYIDATRDRELWVAGVPFMDSLSFTFLTYVGYSCAWQLAAALQGAKGSLDASAYQALRRTPTVLVFGALITTLMDVVIDPVALMGERWFLGEIYGYRHVGVYFGVPLSNFAGWLVVSLAVIGVNQALDGRLPAHDRCRDVRYVHLGGFALFLSIMVFNLAITAWLGAYRILLAGILIVTAFVALSGAVLARSPQTRSIPYIRYSVPVDLHRSGSPPERL